MIAEVAAWAKDNGKTVYELIQDISNYRIRMYATDQGNNIDYNKDKKINYRYKRAEKRAEKHGNIEFFKDKEKEFRR